ncbi:zinc transporter ZIP2 isoform X2 [Eptesicus fuscus]|uniref:zinc transporter ZIP2 isoform X2 n=1 Tax=Eptesicus fuscus TaxID=29078 RepID=UPI002403BB9B|nr:zinc transporter ZIP2 isoform X2 [Eptesicus fuscus]
MEPVLGVKIGCLFALLVLTLVCGLIPICFKWFQMEAARGRHRQVLSLLGCISAGIFLGAGFMHMTAEALEGIESEIQKIVMQDREWGKFFWRCQFRLYGLSLWRAHHLPGLLLRLLFGVAGIAVLSWSPWRIKSAGGGSGWGSCPWTPQPWTSTLTLTESLSSPHPFALSLLPLGVRRSGCGAADNSSSHRAALSCCPGSQGAHSVWCRTAAGAGRHCVTMGCVLHTVICSHVPPGCSPGAGCCWRGLRRGPRLSPGCVRGCGSWHLLVCHLPRNSAQRASWS